MKIFILLFVSGLIFWGTSTAAAVVGGFSEAPVTDQSIIDAANFAVEAQANEIQKEKKTDQVQLELLKVISAQQQVVSGMNYKLELELSLNGEKKVAEAIVWWQEWRKPDPYVLTSWRWINKDI